MFTVLPLGLASACYMFTKLVRPLVKYWRGRGLRIIVYLDDGLCATKGENNAGAAEQGGQRGDRPPKVLPACMDAHAR